MDKYLLILVDGKANINKKCDTTDRKYVLLGSIEMLLVPCPDLLYWAGVSIPWPLRLLAASSSELTTWAKNCLWYIGAMLPGG